MRNWIAYWLVTAARRITTNGWADDRLHSVQKSLRPVFTPPDGPGLK